MDANRAATKPTPWEHRISAAIVAAVSLVILSLTTTPAQADDIMSDGPLNQIRITDTLNCTVYYAEDLYPEFYGGTACGTFVATGGTLFGPSYIPAGGALGFYDYFTPVIGTNSPSPTRVATQSRSTTVRG